MSDDNTPIPCPASTPSSLPSFSSNETAPPPPPEPFTGSSSRPQIPYFSPQAEPPSLHPFSALLTPYATYPDSPPPPGSEDNGDSSSWLPRSTLRCLLLSSSLPPPPPPQRLNEPQTPFKSHAAYHGVDPDEPNIARARAICYRVTKPTHAEACERETRKGVARWLRDLEGREVILVSGPEEVRDWALSGGEGMVDAVEAPLAAGDQEGIEAQAGVAWKLQQQQKLKRQDDEDAPLMLRGRNWPLVGEWLRGEEKWVIDLSLSLAPSNYPHFSDIHSFPSPLASPNSFPFTHRPSRLPTLPSRSSQRSSPCSPGISSLSPTGPSSGQSTSSSSGRDLRSTTWRGGFRRLSGTCRRTLRR